MRFLYNVVFGFLFLITSPYYFHRLRRRGNWKDGFRERFGRYSSKVKQAITNRHVIWMHAVSVGEVNLCTQVIRALEPRLPNLKIVVSTTTTTGMAELKKLLPAHILKIYYPIDRRAYVDRAIRTIHPEAVVLVEAEIWPNFIWTVQDRRIPLFLVNARLSPKSFRAYKRCSLLFRPIFHAFDGVGCQNESDAARLTQLGCKPEAIRIVGNLKFDAAKLEERRNFDAAGILRQLGVPDHARLLVAGSTHAGEEAIVADIYLRIKRHHPDLFLLIAPRHFERGKEVGRELESRGIRFVYRSNMSVHTHFDSGKVECLLLNTTGELRYFYEKAHVVFIGKSLTAQGGQNPIEPGAMGKPMVFGPNMQNFEAIARALVEKNGAIQVSSAEELERALLNLLDHPDQGQQLGANAEAVVKENLGAIENTVDMIVERLSGLETYKAPRRKRFLVPGHDPANAKTSSPPPPIAVDERPSAG